MNKVSVNVGPTRVTVDLSNVLMSRGRIEAYLNDYVRNKMTTWKRDGRNWTVDSKIFRKIGTTYIFPRFCWFEIKDNIGAIPHIDLQIQQVFPKGDKIDCEMKPHLEDREGQKEVVDYLTSGHPICIIEGDTGFGKTYCATKAISKLKMPAIIVARSLTAQWTDSLLKDTDLKEEDVYLLSGNESFRKLYASGIRPKVFITGPDTLSKYAEGGEVYEGLPLYAQFIEDFGIGIKIIDEVHWAFAQTCMIDMAADVMINLYMTATLTQGNVSVLKIFQKHLPKSRTYSTDLCDPHTEYHIVTYPQIIPETVSITPRGYSQAIYERWLMKFGNKGIKTLSIYLIRAIEEFFIAPSKEGDRCIVYLDTIKSMTAMTKILKKQYPHLVVRMYKGGDPIEYLKESDIAVTNLKAASTGKDVPGLRSVFLCVSHGAEIATVQTRGRLRPNKNGPTYLVDLIAHNNRTHQRHAKSRIAYLKDRILKVIWR